ncbi:hypothetical protein ACHQM5_019381 [Ranunculus cassubicifolius]
MVAAPKRVFSEPWWDSKTGQVRNWLDLPQDIIMLHIFNKVGVLDILRNVQMVCSTWRDLCKDPCLFTRIIIPESSLHFSFSHRFIDFIRKVGDKSCGQMIEFSVLQSASLNVVEMVAPLGHSLKVLKLAGMSYFTHLMWAKSFPQLEYLDLGNVWPGRDLCGAIWEVGSSCPNLKSLRLHSVFDYRYYLIDPHYRDDDVAFAIAKYMPRLHSIRLFNDTLSNKGLQAILEGCPQLEYIALQKCRFINVHDRDWLRDCTVFRNKIIKARVYNEAKRNFECYLWTKE